MEIMLPSSFHNTTVMKVDAIIYYTINWKTGISSFWFDSGRIYGKSL